MADKTKEKNETPGGKKKKNKLWLILIIILVAVLLSIGLLGFLFLGGNLPFFDNTADKPDQVSADPPRYIYSMAEFQVNLADPGTRRFLRTTIDLAYNEKALTKEIERRESELRSQIISILRSKYVLDLDEPGGMDQLEGDLIEQLNGLLEAGEIEAIYYKEFIFQ